MIYQNVNGTFVETAEVKVSESGAWVNLDSVKANEGGTYYELLEAPADCIQYIVAQTNASANPPTTSTTKHTTNRLTSGFSQTFSIGITAIVGSCSISTTQSAIISKDCVLSIDNVNSKIKVLINDVELTSTSKNLVVGDTVAVSGSVSVSGSSATTETATLTITIT